MKTKKLTKKQALGIIRDSGIDYEEYIDMLISGEICDSEACNCEKEVSEN